MVIALRSGGNGATPHFDLRDRRRRVSVKLENDIKRVLQSEGIHFSSVRFDTLAFDSGEIRMRCFIEANREPEQDMVNLLAERASEDFGGNTPIGFELVTDLVTRSCAQSVVDPDK